jgi:hypothetical protein
MLECMPMSHPQCSCCLWHCRQGCVKWSWKMCATPTRVWPQSTAGCRPT